MKQLSVTHIITHLGQGGAARNVLQCAIGSTKAGYQVDVIHGPQTSLETDLYDEARSVGIRFDLIPNLLREPSISHDFRCYQTLVKRIRANPPDILHTHQSKAGFLGRLAARQASAGYVIHTPHGHVFQGYFNPIKTSLFRLMEQRAARWCQALTALTQKELQDHINAGVGKPEQWFVIPSGIRFQPPSDQQTSREELCRNLSLPTNSILLISVGRLEKVKGYLPFLQSCVDFFQNSPNLRWLILGEGGQKDQLQELIKQNHLDKQILLCGWQTDPLRWLSGCHGFVHPAFNEGMGRAIIEAFHAGLPVLAGRSGSIPELVDRDEKGMLFDWKTQDPAEALRAFVSNLSGYANYQQLRKIAAADYSEEEMLERLLDLYSLAGR